MAPEITVTDWIASSAAVAACVATFILAIIAWRQSTISDRQTKILRDQTDIFTRQAGYQGQQTTISKQQADIAEKQAKIMSAQTEIARQQLDIIKYQEQERRRERSKAELKAWLTTKFVLHIKNEGKAKAKDIEILIEGRPAHEYPPIRWALIQEKDIPHELDPGASWSPQLQYCVGFEAKFDIKISWLDDSGEPGSFEQRLIPMGSR